MKEQFLGMLMSKLAVTKVRKEYEKNQRENEGTLQMPKFVCVVGIFTMVFCAAVMAAVLITKQDRTTIIIAGIVFGTMFMLGLFLVLNERNFKVIYKDGQIIYRNLLRQTRKYDCHNIKEAYYTDGGGIKLKFNDGKKLRFEKEESYFCQCILQKEHIKCQVKGDENPVIKVYLHPIMMWILWITSGALLVATLFYDPMLVLGTILVVIFSLGCQLSWTEYDKKSKILTRRKIVFSKTYDMHSCSAKPIYEDGYLMAIGIYQGKKKVAKIPVSREYKNRARLVKALCGIVA